MKYPRFSHLKHSKKPVGECEACDKPAHFYVIVEFDYMRGNDGAYKTCQRHASIAQDNIKKFLAHITTKDKFIKRPSPPSLSQVAEED